MRAANCTLLETGRERRPTGGTINPRAPTARAGQNTRRRGGGEGLGETRSSKCENHCVFIEYLRLRTENISRIYCRRSSPSAEFRAATDTRISIVERASSSGLWVSTVLNAVHYQCTKIAPTHSRQQVHLLASYKRERMRFGVVCISVEVSHASTRQMTSANEQKFGSLASC